MYPEEKFTYMEEFAKTLNPNRITARFMLEYLTLYRLENARDELLLDMEKCNNEESKEWAFVYGMDIKLTRGDIRVSDVVSSLSQRSYGSVEMSIYSEIVKFYAYYDMRNIYMMNNTYDDLKEKIKNISNEYVRSNYYARVFLIEADITLHTNKIGQLREKLFVMENSLDPIKSLAYLQIGNSYMFSNYDKARECYLKGMDCATEKSEVELKKSINFLAILWDKFEDCIEDNDRANKLFYYAKKNKSMGINLSEKVNMEELNDHQKGFHYYYLGLLLEDENMFYLSIESFNNVDECFYKQLPLNELKKVCNNPYLLKALGA